MKLTDKMKTVLAEVQGGARLYQVDVPNVGWTLYAGGVRGIIGDPHPQVVLGLERRKLIKLQLKFPRRNMVLTEKGKTFVVGDNPHYRVGREDD